MISKSLTAALLLTLLAACGGGRETLDTQAPPARVLGINDLKLFMQSQQLHLQTKLLLHPAAADWGAIEPEIKANKLLEAEGFPVEGSYTITYGPDLPTHRVCIRFGPYALARPLTEAGCPGDWLQNRADSRATATSMFRLNWSLPPVQQREISLQIRQGMASGRVDTAILPPHGLTAFVQNGSVIEAYSESGRLIWRSDSVGIGEIIDVTDLDGDAMPEVVFSARSGFSASGPGNLTVLSASTGEMLWRYQFGGLELGMNRYRTTIASLDGTGAKSILATMTYSPSLFRFDFSRGARNGVLTWKSEEFIYDSPDKNPLLADLDGDGRQEVVVDSLGTLYSLDVADGRIKSRLTYAASPTFQGFLASQPRANSSGVAITSASDSQYYKGFVTAHYSASGVVRAADREWESGLQNTNVSVEFLDAPLETFSRLRGAVPVTINEGSGNTLHLVDLNTGATVWSLPGYRALYPIAGPNETQALVAHGPEGAFVLSLDRTAPAVLASFPGSAYLGAKSIRHCTPAKRMQCGTGGAVRKDPTGRLHLDRLEGAGKVTSTVVSGLGFPQPSAVVSIAFSGEFALASVEQSLFRIDATGLATRWLRHSPHVFMTPLVADVEGKGVREVITPFGRGLSRLHIDGGSLRAEIPVFDSVPPQMAESFGVPVVLNSKTSSERQIVGFRPNLNPNGTSRLLVSAAASTSRTRWDAEFNQNSWERSLLALPGGSAGDNVALRHSRGTTLIDGGSGLTIWSNEEVGECQRQMASVDWNGDGVGDLLLQTGPTSWVYDGSNGSVLFTRYLVTAYGSYSAVSKQSEDFTLVQSGSGAMAFAAHNGAFADIQLDQRRIESLPVVIGRQSRMGEEHIFRINGTGDLSVFDRTGRLQQQTKLNTPVVVMTGAYIDTDESIDLLLSTSDGKLIAISGKDLKEIWTIQLDGALGTPIATTLDGVTPVILVGSSRGILYVLEN